jgi:hypothetical protein
MELADDSPVDSGIERVRVRVLPDGRMSREDAARYLGHKPKTLAQWQVNGKGPCSVRVAGRVFYFRDELDRFIHDGYRAG